MDKRGLAAIVTTLLVILLVLVAVGVVWGVVRNIIVESSREVSLGKFTLDLEINNVRITEEGVEVSVTRNAGAGELTGISFAISDGVNTQVFDRPITMTELGTEVFLFPVSDFTDIAFAKEVTAVPILGEEGDEIRGELQGNIEFAHPKLVYDVVSERSCADTGSGLGLFSTMDSWQLYTDETGGNAECGGSYLPTSVECYESVTLVEARDICEDENIGARLCTKDELLAGASSSSGCGHDSHMIWSSTECGSEGFYLVYGDYDSTTRPQSEYAYQYCIEDFSTISLILGDFIPSLAATSPEIAVRCCGDDDLNN
jgi:hypothetical protein